MVAVKGVKVARANPEVEVRTGSYAGISGETDDLDGLDIVSCSNRNLRQVAVITITPCVLDDYGDAVQPGPSMDYCASVGCEDLGTFGHGKVNAVMCLDLEKVLHEPNIATTRSLAKTIRDGIGAGEGVF